jgi:hypothetical protein
MPTRRSAAAVVYDLWAGQLVGPIAVDVTEALALAAVLLGVATKDQDPRQLLDIIATAHLDPDRETR